MSILLSLFLSISPAFANEELQQAYQKEYAFLVAQRESIQRQTQQMEETSAKNLRLMEAKLKEGERELAISQSTNEKNFEEIQTLERRRREELGRDAVLASLWKRADRQVKEATHSLNFSPEKLEIDSLPPENLSLQDLGMLGKEALEVLKKSSMVEEFRGTYMNSNKKLVEGTIVRFGRVAAVALREGNATTLGPDGDGRLQEMESKDSAAVMAFLKSEAAGMVPLYLFQSMRERASIRKPGGPMEAVADLAPALFLALLFGMVGWLFFQLAKV